MPMVIKIFFLHLIINLDMNNSTFKIFTIFICGQSEGRACMYLCCPSVRPIKKLEMARNHFILRFSVAKSSISTKSPGEHSFLWIDDCLQKNQNEKDIHVTYINWNCTLMPLLKSCQFEYEIHQQFYKCALILLIF